MKILIIKFAAIGDVLRTTPILSQLKKKYSDAKIWWLTESISYEVLYNNPLIDRVVLYNQTNFNRLKKIHFDILINLDKDKRATYSAMQIAADIKKGFGQAKKGEVIPLDKDSNYAYRLGIDDELKFRKNKKTYQQISFEQIGLRFKGERYMLKLKKQDIDYAVRKLKAKGLKEEAIKIGIVAGSGDAFAGKKLPLESYIKIIEGLLNYNGIQIVLLGGSREKRTNKKLIKHFKDLIIDSGCNNAIGQFAAIIDNCDVVITGDTLTMHLGIALNKYVIVSFGSTAANEIELYGKGEKIIPEIKCSPCYKRKCPIGEKCMQIIKPDDIVKKVIETAKNLFSKQLAEKIIFLDRDGVINKEFVTKSDYVTKPSEFIFIPKVKAAFKILKENYFKTIVISNQAGVAKGLYSKKTLNNITEKMLKEVSAYGGKIDNVYYCLHKSDDNCSCRKPRTGLFRKAIDSKEIDFKNTYYIGDSERDVIAGKRAGLETITVLSGKSKLSDVNRWKKQPDCIAKDLYHAVEKIVLQNGGKK